MKYLKISILITLVSACAHHDHGHIEDGIEGAHKEHLDWKQEHKILEKDHMRVTTIMKWLEEHTKEHSNAIRAHEDTMKEHHKKLQSATKSKDSLRAKKLELEARRLHVEMVEKHGHYSEDHAELMELIIKLEELKEELESHEGH